jgi:methionine synthase / methylenetetrahydrofolate reductase(NADPH)
MAIKLQEALQESIVCGDGAMGTELLAAGVALDVCLEELNISQPDLVSKVHKSYVDAGSQLLETNTFGANSVRLAKHGLENELEAFNKAAVGLAKKAAGNKDIWIAGSVGPQRGIQGSAESFIRSRSRRYFSRDLLGLRRDQDRINVFTQA